MTGPTSVFGSRPLPTRSAFDALDEFLDKFLIDLFMNDQPRRRRAALAARAERSPNRAFDGVVDIGIVHHDDRVLAAHLEADDLVIAGALLGDDPAGFGRAGKRDQPHVGMADQRRDRRLHHGR